MKKLRKKYIKVVLEQNTLVVINHILMIRQLQKIQGNPDFCWTKFFTIFGLVELNLKC